jgi:hypothetical protein
MIGCFDLTQSSGDDAGAGASDAGTGAEAASVVGGGCSIERNSGTQLCRAVSTCPNVVVDAQAMPHCGFRVRGAVVDLVCACGTAICPLGVFATCTDAAQLLANQTEQGVCVQLAEDRCLESGSTPSSSSTSSPRGGNPACDRQCLKDCGGGEACASVCNCD